MPQFDTSTFVSEIIWTLISFGVFYALLKRFILPRLARVFEKRTHLIESEVDAAKQRHEEAERLHQEYQARLDGIDLEAKQMMAEAEQRMHEHRNALMAEWQAEMEMRKKQLHEDAELARQQALRDIRRQTASIVIEATEKTIHQHLNPEEAEKMVDEALGEIETSLKNGNKN